MNGITDNMLQTLLQVQGEGLGQLLRTWTNRKHMIELLAAGWWAETRELLSGIEAPNAAITVELLERLSSDRSVATLQEIAKALGCPHFSQTAEILLRISETAELMTVLRSQVLRFRGEMRSALEDAIFAYDSSSSALDREELAARAWSLLEAV